MFNMKSARTILLLTFSKNIIKNSYILVVTFYIVLLEKTEAFIVNDPEHAFIFKN